MADPAWLSSVDWKCSICQRRPPCKCWVKLTCEWCGATTTVERFEEAGDLDEIETECPKCRIRGDLRP